jgi:hypothetical protein
MLVPDNFLKRLPHTWSKELVATVSGVGSIDTRVRYGIASQPHYADGVFASATLAKKLGLEGISVIELGIAGGRGLIALDNIAL